MLRRSAFYRLDAWLARFRRPGAGDDPGLVPAGPSVTAETLPPTDVARAATLHEPPGPDPASGAPAPPCPAPPLAASPPPTVPPPSPHEQGRRLVTEHRWNLAQRTLERATRAAAGAASEDLASVRDVRRQLRVLRKWPRDVPAHLALGRAYFELGLGADAEATFVRVLTLAPAEPTAPYFLALEHAFRGAWPVAEGYYARAHALAPDLPPFADWCQEAAAPPEKPPGG